MTLNIHLHANFPYGMDRPNAALGYLKSFLSEEKYVNVTNIYWNLPPKELFESISSIVMKLEDRSFDKYDSLTILTAYFAQFFYKPEPNKRYAPVIEPILRSYVPLEEVTHAAHAFKDFIDYSLETRKMADVDIAGFTTNFSQWFMNNYIWSRLKELNPNIIVVAGGFFTKEEAKAFMETFKSVDCAVWGEGEIPLRELVKRLDDTSSFQEVPRLVYRQNGELCFSDGLSDQMTILPFGDHTDYFERVKKVGLQLFPKIPIAGSRFCRWNRCKFCHMVRGGMYYERPVKEIVDEIEYQSKKYDVDRFIFVDTDIGRKSDAGFGELLRALLHSVRKRKKLYDIQVELTPLRITRKYAQMMSNIRMGVQIGFEALTDSLLKRMDKMHRFSENIRALKVGRDYGLPLFGLNVIRNLPGECEEDVIESIENLNYLRFFLSHYHLRPLELTLYKGTPYYEEISAEEKKKRWVVNFLYNESKRFGFFEKNRWDFFGFRAKSFMHYQLWDQFIYLLEKLQSAHISYSWLAFDDGSSSIEEYNDVTGSKGYLLNEVETGILTFCDSIKSIQEVKNEFSQVSEDEIDDAVSQLERENLLYSDKERRQLISILSAENMRCI